METINKTEETGCTECTILMAEVAYPRDEDTETIKEIFRENTGDSIIDSTNTLLKDCRDLTDRNRAKLLDTTIVKIVYKNACETVIAVDDENVNLLKAVKTSKLSYFISITGYSVEDLFNNGYEEEDIDDFKINLDILMSTIVRIEFRTKGSTLKVLNNFFNKEK